MKRIYVKRIIAILILAICIVVAYGYLAELTTLKLRDGVQTMRDFYAQDEGTVDVLVLGSSHAGQEIDETVLWDEYGYSTFDLWGGDQPLSDNYFHLVEALKYQKPRLVILEASYVADEDEYKTPYSWYRSLCGMRASLTKWFDICATVPFTDWDDLVLKLPVYHDRITELTSEDFVFTGSKDNKGYWPQGTEQSIYDDISEDITTWGFTETSDEDVVFRPDYCGETMDLPLKSDYYYRKIIEKCKEESIPLMVVIVPYPRPEGWESTYMRFAKAGEIAGENGVAFVDYNDPTNDLHFTAEEFHDESHLTITGARRLTSDIGKKISELYDIPDHRNDERYESWNVWSSKINAEYLSSIFDVDAYFEEIKRDGFFVSKTDCLNGNHSFYVTDYSEEEPQEVLVGNTLQNQMYEYDGHCFTADLAQYPRVFIRYDSELKKDLQRQAEVYMVYDKYSDTLVDISYLYPQRIKEGILERR